MKFNNSKGQKDGFSLSEVRREMETVLLFSAGDSACVDVLLGGPGGWVQKSTG